MEKGKKDRRGWIEKRGRSVTMKKREGKWNVAERRKNRKGAMIRREKKEEKEMGIKKVKERKEMSRKIN